MANLKSKFAFYFLFSTSFLFSAFVVPAQDKTVSGTNQAAESKRDLIFPGLLKKEELEAGNPLATYAEMIELEKEYRASKIFAAIYPEVRFNFEQFLGLPLSGLQAMQLPSLRTTGKGGNLTTIPESFKPEKAVDVIEREAQKTRIVIRAEEHHLPQTRSLYEQLLKRLWKHGYRYLAAETFTDNVMRSGFKYPDYKTGYYTRDPVYASAVRTAIKLGYKLIAYDTTERGSADNQSFRDQKQAINIKERILDKDSQAKILILAGRGHASEEIAQDGWTPMANVLKKISGIDPFTVYAPTMNQRLTPEEEHPLYRFAVSRGLVKQPTIFVNKTENNILGPGFCDVYVFFPRVNILHGRPDWMETELGRKKVKIPERFLIGKGLQLIQAFELDQPATTIPIDQILVEHGEKKILMLPKGKFRFRAIDKNSRVLNQTTVNVW
ncbi:MAG: hypothetical protein M3209_17090 [Acidobacteriota bacterium]|nr:hypothetical protein [Acidobacteriota bacterium]